MDAGLDELLCFDLYAASRAVQGLYRPLLAELGLTYPQYLVLVVLAGRGGCSIKELSQVMRLDHGTLSPLLRRMEAAGLVRRERSATDERSVRVEPTPAGLALRGRADAVRCTVRDTLGLSEEAFAGLQEALRAVVGASAAG